MTVRGAVNLTDRERGVALDLLLFLMTPEQRGRFMEELPTIYAKVCPTVSPDLLAERVVERIQADRSPTTEDRP